MSQERGEGGAYLVLFRHGGVREVKSCYEEMDEPAGQTSPVETLSHELRHEVLAAARPAVEGEDERFGGIVVVLMTSDRPHHQGPGQVLAHQVSLQFPGQLGEVGRSCRDQDIIMRLRKDSVI